MIGPSPRERVELENDALKAKVRELEAELEALRARQEQT